MQPAQQFRQSLVAAVESRGIAVDFHTLTALIQQLLKGAGLTQADFESVAQTCEAAFDSYVVPFDVPGLPAFPERILERTLRSLIRPLLQTMFAHYVLE